MISTKKAARTAGLLYLLAGIPAPFALIYLPSVLIVRGDAAATARNILASETLFRIGMAIELACGIAFIFVVFALHRLLQGVNKRHASLMVTLFMISVPISCLSVVQEIGALILLRGTDYLSVFGTPQREALAMVFLRLHGHGLVVAAIFWGLWLFPFGLLVYRSGFLPRILGVLLMINGAAYVIDSFTAILLPQYREVVSKITLPFLFGELAVMFWLLIMGAKDRPLEELAA